MKKQVFCRISRGGANTRNTADAPGFSYFKRTELYKRTGKSLTANLMVVEEMFFQLEYNNILVIL